MAMPILLVDKTIASIFYNLWSDLYHVAHLHDSAHLRNYDGL